MPLAACPVCGRGGCRRHAARRRRAQAPRRAYSDTAAYRRMLTAVVDTYGDACAICGGVDYVDDPLVLAHVIAHADGGPFELENLRAAHRSCNARAGRAPMVD